MRKVVSGSTKKVCESAISVQRQAISFGRDFLFAEKYDSYYDEPIGTWEEEMERYQAEQETARIFQEGQGDY